MDPDNIYSILSNCPACCFSLKHKTIKNWKNGGLQPIPKNRSGKLFKKKDFTPKAILEVKQMVESGRLKDHIEAQNALARNET